MEAFVIAASTLSRPGSSPHAVKFQAASIIDRLIFGLVGLRLYMFWSLIASLLASYQSHDLVMAEGKSIDRTNESHNQITKVSPLPCPISTNALQRRLELDRVKAIQQSEWKVPLEQRFLLGKRKKYRVLVRLSQSNTAEGIVECLRAEYNDQGMSEKFSLLRPVIDSIDSFQSAISSMCVIPQPSHDRDSALTYAKVPGT